MGRMIINGTLAPIRKPTEVDFDPARGLIFTEEFHGAGPDSLAGLANCYINSRVAFRWRRGPVSSIVATYSGGQGGIPDAAQSSWELLGNEIQKSIYESGIALAGLAEFPSLTADVKAGFALIEDGDYTGEQAYRNALDGDEQTYYDTLVGFLTRGQTHFAQGQYVLRRSISVSNFYDGVIPGEGNVECLLSTATMTSYDMPTVIRTKVNSIPAPTAHAGYAWSWRQLPSRMVTSAQNRVEVSTEWWLEEWSTTLYGSVI